MFSSTREAYVKAMRDLGAIRPLVTAGGAGPESCPVLVVGAGPTGLMIASELQRRHVPCHLIDARPAPSHWNRATVIHPLSLTIFESMGLVKRFLDAGLFQYFALDNARAVAHSQIVCQPLCSFSPGKSMLDP